MKAVATDSITTVVWVRGATVQLALPMEARCLRK